MTQHIQAPPYNPNYQQVTQPVLRSARGLGQAVIVALAGVIVLELVLRIAAVIASELLRAAEHGQLDLQGQQKLVIVQLESILSLCTAFGLRLPIGILFICWLRRVSSNLGAEGRQWRPGWAVGGWFIPLAYLVIPIMVVAEIDRLSDERAASVAHRPPARARWIVLTLWWIGLLTYLLAFPALIASTVSAELAKNTTDLAASRLAVVGVNAGALLVIAGTAAMAVLLVRRITANQEQLLAAYPQFVAR